MKRLLRSCGTVWFAFTISLFATSFGLQGCTDADDLPEGNTYMHELLFSVDCRDDCSCVDCDTVSFEVDPERCGLYIQYELGCSWSPGGYLTLFGPEGDEPVWSHRVSCFFISPRRPVPSTVNSSPVET